MGEKGAQGRLERGGGVGGWAGVSRGWLEANMKLGSGEARGGSKNNSAQRCRDAQAHDVDAWGMLLPFAVVARSGGSGNGRAGPCEARVSVGRGRWLGQIADRNHQRQRDRL